MSFSIIHYYGDSKSKCGYCKGANSSEAHGKFNQGMHAYTMLPEDYQDLIDRGWRRSGQYCYKPTNNITCCPCYTIKCNALEFKLSKSHKKILKRMQKYLRDGKKDKTEEISTIHSHVKAVGQGDEGETIGREEPQAPAVKIPVLNMNASIQAASVTSELSMENKETQKTNTENVIKSKQDSELIDTDTIRPPRKKAKQLRLERKQAKLATQSPATTSCQHVSKNKSNSNLEKTLADYFQSTNESDKHKLRLDLIHVKSKEFSQTLDVSYALYQKYQTVIHRDAPKDVKDYLSFLQKSPLKHINVPDGPEEGYGSFHQQYWLDDKLIAVAVLDILPYCISSVYFFYDPDYSFLSLGTYGSLREIYLVQTLAQKYASLTNYYMGYYIHSCPKMRYKGKLVPSYLLCPETYTWHLITDEICQKLDEKKYLRLNPNANAIDANAFSSSHLDKVLLLMDTTTYIKYRDYVESFSEDCSDRESIMEYGRLVGKNCAHRMLYVKM